MRNRLVKILVVFQIILFIFFVVIQHLFFRNFWALISGLPDIISLMNSILIWLGLILLLFSIVEFYFSKIRKTLISRLVGNSIIAYIVFLYIFYDLFSFFNIHIIISLFCIFSLIFVFYSYIIYTILIIDIIHPNDKQKSLARKTILDLGTQFTRLEVREIAEECKIDRDMIIRVILEMINGNEIHAEYFKSSKTVAFDQEANLNEFDNLKAYYGEKKK